MRPLKGDSGQTHFVGVTVSGPLAETVAACRRWMHERYGCKSGHQTPPHVTLIPPFALPEDVPVGDLETVLAEFAARASPFQARLRGFGAFAERTVFVRVEPNPAWDRWHDGLYSLARTGFPSLLKADKRPFTPHLTVSNRDIPPGAVPEALAHFQHFNLDLTVPVDHVALFERVGSRWEIRNGWYAE